MIIFFESGRLGNQLFQYCAMKKYKQDEFIVAIGMRELREEFSGIDIASVSIFGRIAEKIIRRIGKERIEYAATKLRILTMVEELRSTSGIEFSVTPGLLRNQIYFKAGYYQSEHMVDKELAENIRLKEEHKMVADQFFDLIPGKQVDRYFVHIRRGDYINWPSRETPAVLPLHWYRTQMELIRSRNSNALFAVVSDDKPYADEFFSHEKDVVIACGDLMNDFSIMTKCLGGGILSASSLSWWASYFIRRENTEAKFIAPMFWGGHQLGSWYPEQIQTSWIDYANVEANV